MPIIVDDWDERRRKLYWALRSRVLSLDEMKEVERFDWQLCVAVGQSYNEGEKRREFNDALLVQFKMRLEIERTAASPAPTTPAQSRPE